MVKTINIKSWHITLLNMFDKVHQYDKIIEELQELDEAIVNSDRNMIVEELADVENVLPYLLRFINKKECKIKYNGDDYDYRLCYKLLIDLIFLKLKIDQRYEINKCIGFFLDILCYSLYNIYAKYSISAEEVDRVIEFKRKRTLRRYFGQ